jgi:hypothetical protein
VLTYFLSFFVYLFFFMNADGNKISLQAFPSPPRVSDRNQVLSI